MGSHMDEDKFDLTWKDFGENAAAMVRHLFNDSKFTDVTLVSDDRKRIKAHKVILSSCSLFFNQVLAETSTEHPLLFLKGIQHSELLAIVKFIYLGTSQVGQENLNKFMQAAEDLEIQGLKQNRSIKDDFEDLISNQHTEVYNSQYHQEDSMYEDETIKDIALYHGTSFDDVSKRDIAKGNDGLYSCDT